MGNITSFCENFKDNNENWHDNATEIIEMSKTINEENTIKLELITSLFQLEVSCDSIKNNKEKLAKTNFKNIKDIFLNDFDYYAKTLKGCLKILSMIYYCLLLIAITCAGVAMMFYACLKRQGYLITFMHVIWNVIRFFMFSFFLYGTAYGIGFLALRDSIAVIMKIFGEGLDDKILGGGKDLLEYCLKGSDTNMLSKTIVNSVKNFFLNIDSLKNKNPESGDSILFSTLYDNSCLDASKSEQVYCKHLNIMVRNGTIDASFDCGFLKNDLNNLYRALSDASVESRILAALSLCSSFFGAVAVYFYLLVMHHYNNELFFDSGKSIFTGFDGFGGGYKKKVHDKDPAFKKRKLRAEIELTSKNDEQSAYKNVNKNEDEE